MQLLSYFILLIICLIKYNSVRCDIDTLFGKEAADLKDLKIFDINDEFSENETVKQTQRKSGDTEKRDNKPSDVISVTMTTTPANAQENSTSEQDDNVGKADFDGGCLANYTRAADGTCKKIF